MLRFSGMYEPWRRRDRGIECDGTNSGCQIEGPYPPESFGVSCPRRGFCFSIGNRERLRRDKESPSVSLMR